ncbi:hypothetical protein RUND412_006487 [Rhizina undulata]
MVVQIPLIWITAVFVLVLLVVAAAVFVKIYEDPHDRDHLVTTVCILALTSLLATVCLLPVDIALVSSTTDNVTGLKKSWATPEAVGRIMLALKVVYYLLYSLDAGMCLLAIPFAYFWYEEWDDEISTAQRVKSALKYCVFFLATVTVLMVLGFVIPTVKTEGGHLDLDYFKRLLAENRGERALTFVMGVLLCVGILPYVIYTAPGLALAPLVFIKSVPDQDITTYASIHDQLTLNREQQRAIEIRYVNADSPRSMTAKDRRELESLQREERTLVRRERIAEESVRGSKKVLKRLQAIGRPFKILFGIAMLSAILTTVASMLVTSIDKLRNSVCGRSCGYILGSINYFNPMNWIFVETSRIFPVDYVLALILVLVFFVATVVGIVFVGFRLLWVKLFEMRSGRTEPQAMLLATVLLTLSVLAINYVIAIIVAPQYAQYGGQMFCDHTIQNSGLYRDCTFHKELIRPCNETSPQSICTPTVVSTFINRLTINFPYFGIFAFWSQFAFLAIFALALVYGIFKTPSPGRSQAEEDDAAEREEEEQLLSAGADFSPAYRSLRGKFGGGRGRGYGAVRGD